MLKKFYKLFPFVLVFSFIFISTASALTVPAGWYNYSVAGTSFSAKACDRPEGAFSGTKNCIADIVTNSALDKVDVSYSDQDLGQTLKLYKDTTSVSTNLLVTSSSNTCTPSTPCVYNDKPSWSASTGLKTRQYIVNDETTDSSAAIYNITLSYAPVGITGLVDGANFTWGNSLPLNKTVNITCTNATNMTLDGVSVGTKNGYTIAYPFTNTNSSTNTITKTIVCTNIGGTTNQQTRTFNLPGQISGTITATNCTIANGASTCNSTVSWNTINPGSTISQVTSNYPSAGTVISNTNTNSQSIAIPYSSRAFFLYNGGAKLDEATAVATCATGTSWNAYQGKCTPAATTTLTGANCTIALGANSCTTTINWSVTNPAGTTAVTSNYPAANTSIGTTHTGSASGVTIPYASRSFWLYNGGVQKATLVVQAACVSGGVWDTTKLRCVPICNTSLNEVVNSAGTACVCPTNYVKDSKGYCHAACVDSTWNENTRTCDAPVPSLTAANCTILGNASSCNTTLNWSMNNPVGPTAVTSSYPSANTVLSTAHSGTLTQSVPYSSRTFFLYNNSIERVRVTPTATCITGTTWNGSICACPTGYLWNATTKTCNQMIGTLTPTTCTIPAGANSCSITLSWTTTNPINTSQVTSSYPTAGTVVGTGNNGSTTTQIYYSPRSFYLYNSGILLKSISASAVCATGSTWNTTTQKCEKPAGTLTGANCSIAIGASSCNTTISWNVTNAIGSTAVTSNYPSAGTTIGTGHTGSVSGVTIPHSSRSFWLYNNGTEQAALTVNAICVSGSSWNSSLGKCSPSCTLNQILDSSGTTCICPPSLPNKDVNGYCYADCFYGEKWDPTTRACVPRCPSGQVYVDEVCMDINRNPICTWLDPMVFTKVTCDVLYYPCSDGSRSVFNIVYKDGTANKVLQNITTFEGPNNFNWSPNQLEYRYVCPNRAPWYADALERPYTHFVAFDVSAGQVRKGSTINLSWNVQLPTNTCKIVATSLKDGRVIFDTSSAANPYPAVKTSITTIPSVTSLNYSSVNNFNALTGNYYTVNESTRFTVSCNDVSYNKGYSQLVRDVYVTDEADR